MPLQGLDPKKLRAAGVTYDSATDRYTSPTGAVFDVKEKQWYVPSKEGGLIALPVKGLSFAAFGANIPGSQGASVGANQRAQLNAAWDQIKDNTTLSLSDFQTGMTNLNSSFQTRSTGQLLTGIVKEVAPIVLAAVGSAAIGGGVGGGAASASDAFGTAGVSTLGAGVAAPVAGGVAAGGAAAGGATAGGGGAAAGGTVAAGGTAAAGGAGSMFANLGNIAGAVGSVGGLLTSVLTPQPPSPSEDPLVATARRSQAEELARVDASLNAVRKRSQMGKYGARFFRTSAMDRLGNSMFLQRSQGPTTQGPAAPATILTPPKTEFRIPTTRGQPVRRI